MRSIVISTALSLFALFIASCSGEVDQCLVEHPPAVPILLGVTQDPESLTVTATIRDESDNEQWFALERALVTRKNLGIVVGTDIPAVDSNSLPLGTDVGNTVSIVDLGIIKDSRPEPGQVYVYTVRAWNCRASSAVSNNIKITSLFPR